ncbi:MAG: hypothetical protein ACOY5R_00795 [Pseudomonadota bacterium]|nr:hypothetical protein [Rhizorhabdus phycosphaerae]
MLGLISRRELVQSLLIAVVFMSVGFVLLDRMIGDPGAMVASSHV